MGLFLESGLRGAEFSFEYLDAAADSHHRRLSGRGGDGDGAHLIVEAIVVSVINDKVEDVSHGLTARL